MSMQLIKDSVSALRTSKPIFKIQVNPSNWQGTACIELGDSLVKANNDHLSTSLNVFDLMAQRHFKEQYHHDSRTFKVDRENVEKLIYNDVRDFLITFIKQHLATKTKNFDTSKLGKWYYRFALDKNKSIPTNGLQNNIISVFKYLFENNAQNRDAEQKHVNNGIAVLKAICEKYYNEDDTRMRRRRRRRK